MRASSIPAPPVAGLPRRSKRLLALAGDERLVEQIRAGSEAAFEVAFERHGQAILGFCRHMLGSVQEAEDAVQHTFASAYRALLDDDRPIRLKPWLFTIARNRSLSVLRARREPAVAAHEIPTAGLADQVEQRAELRDLLSDLRDLPHEQRAALLLAELGSLSHAEVAEVIGCEVQRVKALVFRARSGLIERREARDTPCADIREQLANLRGGSLRRSELRHHLRVCAGCRDYRQQVKRQRRLLGAALPVTPSVGLKSSVLGGLGLGGGSAGGLGTAAGSLGLAAATPVGATVAKVAMVAVLVGGGVVAGERALVPSNLKTGAPTQPRQAPPAPDRATAPTAVAPRAVAAPKGASTRRGDAQARGRRRARGHAVGTQPKAHEHPTARSGRGKAAERRPARTPQARSPRSAFGRTQPGRSVPKREPITRIRAPKKAHAGTELRPVPSQKPPGKRDTLTSEGG